MSDFLTGVAAVIAAAGAIVATLVGYLNRRSIAEQRAKTAEAAAAALIAKGAADTAKEAAEASTREIIATKEGVFELGKQIDGRLSELLALTEAAAHARGRLEGREEARP